MTPEQCEYQRKDWLAASRAEAWAYQWYDRIAEAAAIDGSGRQRLVGELAAARVKFEKDAADAATMEALG